MSDAPPTQQQSAAPPPVTEHPAPPPPPLAPRPRANRRSLILGILVALLLLGIGAYFLLPGLYAVATDDAYVDAHVVSIIPEVPAYVAALHVDDNSKVAAGAPLIELDARDYRVRVDLARAGVAAAEGKLDEARDQISVMDADIGQNRADLALAQANARLATINLKRLRSVSDIRAVSSERVDEAKAAADGTQASVTAAQIKVQASEAQAEFACAQAKTAEASLALAKASLAQAALNLSYTRIDAPVAGSVANKSVEQGNFVQPGQMLLSIVPNEIYIVANYKETQLTHVEPGQPVHIFIDGFPDRRFRGHVGSIQRGTGSRFALLPPENATGNFVKVVQRVPVKIVFDDPPGALREISPGMSVETEIFIARRPAWLSFLN